jgi:hypothetical protein
MSRWCIDDLILLRDAGVQIDADDFREAYRHENTHRDFSFCAHCGASTFQQHLPDCPRESILGDPNWYEEIKRRNAAD